MGVTLPMGTAYVPAVFECMVIVNAGGSGAMMAALTKLAMPNRTAATIIHLVECNCILTPIALNYLTAPDALGPIWADMQRAIRHSNIHRGLFEAKGFGS